MRARDENKEQAIRHQAIDMIVKEGLDGFSMQKLAKAAGVSPATLYIYYKHREDLIIQLYVEVNNKMLEASLKNFNPDMSFEEGLKVQWKNRAAFFMQYKTEVLFIEKMKHTHFHDKAMEGVMVNFKGVMGKFVHNAKKKNELIELPFEVFWSVAYAPLYQLIKFHTEGKSFKNKTFSLNDKILMQTFQLVIKALKP